MKSGVKIYCDTKSPIYLYERLQINNGVEIATGYDRYNGRSYRKNAYKPVNTWKPLNEEQYSLLVTADKNATIQRNVGFIKIPENLIDQIKKIGFPDCSSEMDFSLLFEEKSTHLNDLTLLISNFFAEIIEEDHSLNDVKLHCISYEKPGIETVAYTLSDDKYLGLHIDNGKGVGILGRSKNPNRLSINLGKEPRFLFFVNQTIEGMINMILEKDKSFNEKKESVDEDHLVSLFFKHYPDYPILRLKQNPFEAYIAPTDNIIHDGSTLEKMLPDMTMVFIGYFKLYYDPQIL